MAQHLQQRQGNRNFLMALADRTYKATANGGALTDDAALKRFNTLNDAIHDAIVAESARWGDTVSSSKPVARDAQVQNEINFVRDYIKGNAADLITALHGQGYYPSNNPATFSRRGGVVTHGFHPKPTSRRSRPSCSRSSESPPATAAHEPRLARRAVRFGDAASSRWLMFRAASC
jgi:hypothetical protein